MNSINNKKQPFLLNQKKEEEEMAAVNNNHSITTTTIIDNELEQSGGGIGVGDSRDGKSFDDLVNEENGTLQQEFLQKEIDNTSPITSNDFYNQFIQMTGNQHQKQQANPMVPIKRKNSAKKNFSVFQLVRPKKRQENDNNLVDSNIDDLLDNQPTVDLNKTIESNSQVTAKRFIMDSHQSLIGKQKSWIFRNLRAKTFFLFLIVMILICTGLYFYIGNQATNSILYNNSYNNLKEGNTQAFDKDNIDTTKSETLTAVKTENKKISTTTLKKDLLEILPKEYNEKGWKNSFLKKNTKPFILQNFTKKWLTTNKFNKDTKYLLSKLKQMKTKSLRKLTKQQKKKIQSLVYLDIIPIMNQQTVKVNHPFIKYFPQTFPLLENYKTQKRSEIWLLDKESDINISRKNPDNLFLCFINADNSATTITLKTKSGKKSQEEEEFTGVLKPYSCTFIPKLWKFTLNVEQNRAKSKAKFIAYYF
ncbi:hypothetical protein ABK040_011123 [Willaertia magna]